MLHVLGLSPGIQRLGYAMLAAGTSSSIDLIDADTLRVRKMSIASTAGALSRLNAHMLILRIVLERNPPALVALGPQCIRAESPEYIDLVRRGIRGVSQALRVPCYEYVNRAALTDVLHGEPWAAAQAAIEAEKLRDRSVVFAALAAHAAIAEHRGEVQT